MLTIDQIQVGVIYRMRMDDEEYVLFRCYAVAPDGDDDETLAIYDDGYLKIDINKSGPIACTIDTSTPATDSDDLKSLQFATEEEIALYLKHFPYNTPKLYQQTNNHYSIF